MADPSADPDPTTDRPEPSDLELMRLSWRVLALMTDRGDAERALWELVGGLSQLLGCPCALLGPGDGDGGGGWVGLAQAGSALVPHGDDPAAQLAHRALVERQPLVFGDLLACPVSRLGVASAVLLLRTDGRIDLGRLALRLEPVLGTAASLLHRSERPRPGWPAAGQQLQLRSALHESGTFVWEWDIDSDVLSDIDEGELMLGYQRHELGRTQADWNRVIHPDDLAPLEEAYQAHARGEREVYEFVYRARARHGSWLWIEERGRIVQRGADGRPLQMVGTQTDVSDRVAMQLDARESARRLDRIAREVPGLLFQYEGGPGVRGRFSYLSPRCLELLGLEPAPLRDDARLLLRRLERADVALLGEQAAACLAQGRHVRMDLRLHHPGGELRWLRLQALPERGPPGAPTTWHGHVDDITDLRELEHARQDRAELAAAHRAQTAFLTRMSHELRTPLNAVIGFTELMRDDAGEPPQPRQAQRLGRVLEAGEHLLGLISDLLDLTHLEDSHMVLAAEPVAVLEALAQAATLMRPLADRRALRLEVESLDPALAVRADRRRLRQVLFNLIGNAIKYNRPEGSVTLSAQAVDGRVRLSVRDSGEGLSPAELAQLFQPFNRLGREAGEIEGAGVGLALSRRLARAMGGDIEVRSQPGVGSVFSLLLPEALPDASPPA